MQVLAKLFCMSNKNLHVNVLWCFDFFVVGFFLFGFLKIQTLTWC